jgi:hypothetical protein
VGASPSDPGGTIDRTAEIGQTYQYTAQRVSQVTVAGHELELRSVPSAPVTVAMLDIFPPGAPTGLVAVPGFLAGAAGAGATGRPTIDLSWQPNGEARVAGYRVYRQEVLAGQAQGSPRLVTAELAQGPGYRDPTVEPGHTYSYRVTAVDDAGNESPPSAEAIETAATQ